MRVKLLFPLILLLTGLFLLGASLVFFLSFNSASASQVVSPIITEPQADDLFKESVYDQIKKEKTTDNFPPNSYFPENLNPKFSIDLELSAEAFAVMDRDLRKLLLAKNLTSEKQIASLVKIMVALIALEKEKLEREIVVNRQAAEIGEATMGALQGEIYTLEELLHGLLLTSGNDAAEAIAGSLGRGRYWFLDEMNKKAVSLGMRDTYFVNPTGLDEDSPEVSSFSTSLDLLALTNYALNNKKFTEIVSTKYHFLPYKENYHKALLLENILNFDRVYPGIKGVKTGNSDFAKQTLISYAEHQGKRIIVVLLGSLATRDDAVKIYKYIFEDSL